MHVLQHSIRPTTNRDKLTRQCKIEISSISKLDTLFRNIPDSYSGICPCLTFCCTREIVLNNRVWSSMTMSNIPLKSYLKVSYQNVELTTWFISIPQLLDISEIKWSVHRSCDTLVKYQVKTRIAHFNLCSVKYSDYTTGRRTSLVVQISSC